MTKITLLGTGLMGFPMAERLLEQGQQVAVYNRTLAKAQPLAASGAAVCSHLETALAEAELVLLMLADDPALQAICAAAPLSHWQGKTVLQMGTLSPAQSRTWAERFAAQGANYLECPVLGSIPQARSGELILISAGPQAVLEKCLPVLTLLGQPPVHLGEQIGLAAAAKLALNQLIPSLIAMFGLSLHFVKAQGVDPEAWMQILRASALYAPAYDKKRERLLENNFSQPNFPVKHMIKDIQLFLEAAHAPGSPALDTRMADALLELLQKAQAQGLAEADYSAVGNMVLAP